MRGDVTGNGATAPDASGHATDADLLRILDHEVPLSPQHDTTAHVSACAECAARADILHNRRIRLGALLAAADVPVLAPPSADDMLARMRGRRPAHARPGLRAAALLLVVGALAAAQPAVRRWAGSQWERVTSTPSSSASAPTAGRPPQARGSVLAFDAGSGPLTIVYDVRPAAGSLIVVSDTGALVRMEQVSGANLELLVTRRRLHVRNAVEGAPANFVVHVPRDIARVDVRYGASAQTDTTFDILPGTRTVVNFR